MFGALLIMFNHENKHLNGTIILFGWGSVLLGDSFIIFSCNNVLLGALFILFSREIELLNCTLLFCVLIISSLYSYTRVASSALILPKLTFNVITHTVHIHIGTLFAKSTQTVPSLYMHRPFSDHNKPAIDKKSIDAKHQRATPKEFDPDLHLNT
jgi:hypothetical protein